MGQQTRSAGFAPSARRASLAAHGLALLLLTFAHAGCAPEQSLSAAPQATVAVRRVITADRVPANRVFSPAILTGSTLYISGQSGLTSPAAAATSGISDQTRTAMENIGALLTAAGMGYANLVKCHVYLASMDDYVGMNQAYGSYFSGRVPARTTVQAAGLPLGARVQIACVAYGDLSRISVVQPPKGSLPAPLGPYSAGVWAGDTLYLSGMGGQFPEGRRLPPGFDAQVRQTLVNIRTTLEAAGLGLSDVAYGEAYVTTPEEAPAFPAAYWSSFSSPSSHPQAVVFVPRLPGEIKTEITVVATRGSGSRRTAAGVPGSGVRATRTDGAFYTHAESAEDEGAGFEEQYVAVLKRQEATLRQAGLGWADVADVQVYVSDLKNMDSLDRLFRDTFAQDPPARTTIRVQPNGSRQVQSSLVAVRRGTAR